MPSVQVRANDKENYSRVVFDWGKNIKSPPSYSVQQTKTSLIISFKESSNFTVVGNSPASLSRVSGYKTLGSNKIEIKYPSGQNVRHFITDNRLVIDIKGETVEKEISKIESAAGEQTIKEKIKKEVPETKNIIVDEVKPETQSAPPPEKSPHHYQMTMTSTTSVPMTAFDRNGYFWVVLGQPNIKSIPQISGDGADALGQFQPIPANGVSAFRIRLPENIKKSVTGGGLVWKVELSEKIAPSGKPVEIIPKTDKTSAGEIKYLLWPALSLVRTVEINDPDIGDTIAVALVDSAKDMTRLSHSFVDVDFLPSYVGLAALPKTDTLKITKADDGLRIDKEGGLNLSSEQDRLTVSPTKETVSSHSESPKELTRIYNFSEWKIGTEKELSNNQRLMMAAMAQQTDSKKAESLISLAKLTLSYNYAPEAIGYLELAQSMVPELDTNPEFIALQGAAEALSWKNKEAFRHFSAAGLNDIGEIVYWKSFALAKLDDWQQAAKILPDDVSVLKTYTDEIKTPLALVLAEVALRDGNIDKAKNILEIIKPLRENMSLAHGSAYDYLSGELDRQDGRAKESKKIWKELSEGDDDLYRAKAKFALTMLQREDKEITEDKAVDNLEGLRYAWRGDDLEVSINYNLAKIYLTKNEPVKALTLMDLAHSLNPVSEQGKKIDADMHQVFKDIFKPEKIKSISPADILTVYNEFSKLIPVGADGEILARQLAEKMASADLLPRAIALLKKQIDGGAKGTEGADIAIRLAAFQNMNSNPDEALQTLDRAEAMLKDSSTDSVLSRQEDIGLLRAKAFSLKGKPDDAFSALALLPQNDESLRLRADIAWRGKKWQDAADSLEQLVQNQNIVLTRPLTDEQADLLLNWAVALYLADNRYVLANLRERYSDAMTATPKAQKFEVVTRPRQASLLSDRETINSIIDETSIFKDFMKSFKAGDVKTEPPIGAPPAIPATSETTVIPEALRNNPAVRADEVLGD